MGEMKSGLSISRVAALAPFPWSVDIDNDAVIRDALGEVVAIVDNDRERNDEEVADLSTFIVDAANRASREGRP